MASPPAPPNLGALYQRQASAIFPELFDFRLQLLNGGRRPVPLDAVTEGFSWEDSGPLMTASVALRRPDPERFASLPIHVGDTVRCQVRWKASWYGLWEMRVQPFETDLGEGTMDVDLQDQMAELDRGRRHWSYRKTKRRPNGWTADEIARDVAQELGVPVGQLARGTKRIKRLVRDRATGLQMIKLAYTEERDHTGIRFVIRLRDGKLEVIPLRRNSTLYVIRDQITAALAQVSASRHPVTKIVGTGHVGKGHGASKVRFTAESRAAAARFGHVTHHENYGRVDSLADLREKVHRDLAKAIRIRRTATLTVPGIPFIRRGDAARWVTPEAGWSGGTDEVHDRSFVYARNVSHTVDSSGYSTTLEVVQDDPYVADQKRRDKEARARARSRRKAKAS